MTAFGDVREQWGLPRALWSRVAGALRPWMLIARVRIRAVEPEMLRQFPTAPGIEIREATEDELSRAAAAMPAALSSSFVIAARARGDVCAAAFDGPAMLSFSWFSFSEAPGPDGTIVEFSNPYRYIYKSYTRDEYRGMRLQQPVLFALDAEHLTKGYTHTIGYVETHNYASINAGVAAGAQWVGYAGYLRCFGRILAFRSPGARRHSFCFRSGLA